MEWQQHWEAGEWTITTTTTKKSNNYLSFANPMCLCAWAVCMRFVKCEWQKEATSKTIKISNQNNTEKRDTHQRADWILYSALSISLSLSFCYFRVDSGSDDDYFIITTIMNRRYVSHTHIESYSLVMFKLRRRWTKKRNN